jgi:hypothetical protein
MTHKYTFTTLAACLLAIGSLVSLVQAADTKSADTKSAPATDAVNLFQAIEDHQVDAKFIAKNDHDARLLITNKTNQPINLKLPEAFAGVPLAQFGGGARGGGGGGFGGGNRGGGGGGQQQQVGGGGGGIGAQGGGGGGGGFFSVPPEETAKINFAVVCLDHGLRTPNGSAAYKIVPADEHLDPAVVELLKAFGRGELQHGAAQAATWHLNSGLTWDQLAAKLQGTRRSGPNRAPYFTAADIRAGQAYASEATRLAELNADEYAQLKKARAEKAAKAKTESSEARSTTDSDSTKPADKDANKTDDSTESEVKKS